MSHLRHGKFSASASDTCGRQAESPSLALPSDESAVLHVRNPFFDDAPIVIGATGGSGTRMVRRMLEHAGVFMGAHVNEAGDCMPFEPVLDRLINPVLHAVRGLDYRLSDLPAPLVADGLALCRRVAALHLADAPAGAVAWGWKNPRAMYLLPFFHALFPRLRFVHLLRDGRDMALSGNQWQLARHFAAMFGEPVPEADVPAAACRLWEHANRTAAAWADRTLGLRCVRLRFEDVCAAPQSEARRLLRALDLDTAPAAEAAGAVRPPASLGRWRALPAERRGTLTRIGTPALAVFGYDGAPATAPERPVALLVAGMHRSGTSAVVRALNLLGAALPSTLLAPDAGNPAGYWESPEVIRLNDEALASAGLSWDATAALPPDWFASPAATAFERRVTALLTREFTGAPLFAVKDPRLCRLLPAWLRAVEALGVRPVVVLPVRHPAAVARSLARRDGMPAAHALQLWLRHALDAERASRGVERMFVAYEDLAADPAGAAGRLRTALPDLPLRADADARVAAFLEPERGTGAPAGVPLPEWVARAHARLADACRGRDGGLPAAFDALAAEWAAAEQLYAPPTPVPRTTTLEQALALATKRHRGGAAVEAEAIYRRILTTLPAQPDALHLLGLLLHQTGRHGPGAALIGRAVAVRPGSALYHSSQGTVLQAMGRFAEAERSLRRALALKPTFWEAHSNLILGLDYDATADTATIQAECRRWFETHGRPLVPATPRFAVDADPDRRLRVGYVSADFRQHPAAEVLLPILESHDHSAVEAVCYSGGEMRDAMTARCRAAAAVWRDTAALSDEELTAQVRADGIDILVNVAGHAHGSRLPVFARRPAPVQVSAWGLPRGTGLPVMDALFLDPVIAPPGERHLYAEEVVDLPCWLVFRAPDDAPPVGPLPMRAAGALTLGSASRLEKLSDGTVALWSRVLARIPAARLLLKSWHLGDPAQARALAARFAGHGVPPERLILDGTHDSRDAHMAVYRRMDLALDPFPHGGGITTCDSLWMGVPVVTLRGRAPAGRGTAAILHAVGLADWVAEDADAYVDLVAAKAADPDGLATLRETLRERFARSPAGDAGTYTRAVEAVYRRLWRRWCASAR